MAEPAVPCVHRFRVSEPDGSEYVAAVCQKCGATRSLKAGFDHVVTFRSDYPGQGGERE